MEATAICRQTHDSLVAHCGDDYGIWLNSRSVAKTCAGVLLTCAVPATAQVMKTVDFSGNCAPVTVSDADIEVTLQPVVEDELIAVAAAIRAPGFQSVIVQEPATSSYAPHVVGIVKLAPTDPVPSVLLGGFTGGAHCCATFRVVAPWNGRLKTIEFEVIDGGPDETLPTDINADGIIDFIRQDDNFRYAFASGAGSISPPVVFNIFKGQLVNVSDDPSFRPLWETLASNSWKVCVDPKESDRNGACIAFVAASARLGKYQEGLRVAVKHAEKDGQLPTACKVEAASYDCPAGQEIKFYNFEAAAVWFLRQHGYTD